MRVFLHINSVSFFPDTLYIVKVVTRLSRVGYDNTLGYLNGGIAEWTNAGKEVDTVESIPASEMASRMKAGEIKVVDVRKESEYSAEHIADALNLPLDYLNDTMDKLEQEEEYNIHCAGGYRSMIAASILKARGYHKLVDIAGGFKAIAETDIPRTDYVCPTTAS